MLIRVKKQLEAIHTESARIVSGATKHCSIEKLLVELGWESLQSRRNKHKLILFYKILHGLTSDYLNDLLPPLVQDTTSYNLQNSDNIQNYRARSNLFLNPFFPSTIRAWNDLPNDTKNVSSVASFKHRLKRNLKPPPKYYNVGSRKGQILQARLRLECSSLTFFYLKHIVPSPSCQCGEFGSAAHFLFNCPIFTNERQTDLPNNLRTFTTKDLLFGCENSFEQDNQSLFLQVQDFIVNSRRFP